MKCKLSEIMDLITGGTPKTRIAEYWGGEIPWLSVKDFNNDYRYVYETEKTITKKGLENSSTKLLEFGDTIISARGTVGELAMIPFPMAFNQSCYGLRAKRHIVDPTFMYYLVKNKVKELKQYTQGSVFDTITKYTFDGIEVKIPKMENQLIIAKFLSNIDDKIELNSRINKNLAEQISALSNSWLTDYEPFGGVLPNDWAMTSLSKIATFTSGYSYKGSELQTSDVAMATIKNFNRKGGFKLDGFKEIIPSSKLKKNQHAELFDTLVAHTDLTQNAEVIGNAEPILSYAGYSDIVFSMDVVKVLPARPEISKFLIAALLKDKKFKDHCLGYVNGTTVLHLSKKALPEYHLMLPNDLSVLKPLDDAVGAMYIQMAHYIDESVKLAALRDELLPKLMSEEIEVADLSI
ncbi:MAG: restriction endonuclease subunit S [Faecalicoccus sp.]|nr:restriction endonuclease subunit S [Faecalicoccus sp.]